LLRICLPEGLVGEAVLGDLHTEYDRRVRSAGRAGAAVWYCAQTVRIGASYLLERATHRHQYEDPGGLPSRRPARKRKGARSGIFESILYDIRYAVRTLRKEPGWTAGAVCTLALAIGATTSIFSVVNAIVLRPLDYPEPNRLVALEFHPANEGAQAFFQGVAVRADYFRQSTTYPNFEAWQETTHDILDYLAVYDESWTYDVNLGSGAERMPAALVSAGAFRALGVPPALGRWFSDADDVPGSANVVVLSYDLWRTFFGTDADVIGRTINIREKPHTIVGVMPRGFSFPTASTRFWMPMAEASRNSGSWNYEVFGRLTSGVSMQRATALIGSRRIESAARDGSVRAFGATLTPLHYRFVGDARPVLLIFMAAVSAVLLIACVNVINLMLTRATHREHEHVVRSALGARPARLVQQLLTESTLLCLVGAGLGLLLAVVLTDVLVALSPATIPRREQIGIDGSALAFTLALAVAVGLSVGLTPAMQASRSNLATGLNAASRGASGGIRHTRLRDGFVVVQLALAFTLLVCGGALFRSFAALLALETGVSPVNVLVFDTSLPESRYQTFEDRKQFYDEMLERLRGIPGVRTASLAVYFPASGWFHTTSFQVEGYAATEEELQAEEKQVTPDYFQTLGIAPVKGRVFEPADGASGPEVLVINESMARRYWPDGNAVGGRIRLDEEWLSVVGVVSDVRYRGELRDFPQLYRPYAGASFPWSMDGLLRVESDPIQYAASVRRIIAEMDPDVVVADLQPLEHFLWDAVSEPRFRTLLLGVFSIAAVILSMVGVYGVMAYAVALRTREFGIRKALGANHLRTIREVATRGFGITAIGVGVGVFGAYAAVGILQRFLFDLSAHDPLTFVMAIVALAVASMLACCVPALRAASVDPLVALRAE
jgi:putative ABC transport system permease protein